MISSHLLSDVVSFVEVHTGTTDIHAQSLCEEQFYRKRRRDSGLNFIMLQFHIAELFVEL
jgi:hypothetical protein